MVHAAVLFLPDYKSWKGVSVICTTTQCKTQTRTYYVNWKMSTKFYVLLGNEENEENLTDYPCIM